MMTNELYLVTLPLIHITVSPTGFGMTEQVLTLMPDRNFATNFFPDEVDSYIATFMNRQNLLRGGHVRGYRLTKEDTDDGRVIVKVTQDVD